MLDFIKDIFSSFRQNSLERIKSPFLGAFDFSWLSFNWQMLAVLILSKQGIVERLEYINKNFSIKDYMLAPLFTTALICILLPLINKAVTRMQKKTNLETNQLILQSKIDIAEEQLKIADIEAQKRLAEEREKKNIDANIALIIKESEFLHAECKRLKDEIQESSVSFQKIKSEESALWNANQTLESNLSQVRDELSNSLKSISRINTENASLRKENVEVEFLKIDRERLKNDYQNAIKEKLNFESLLNDREEKVKAYNENYEWYTKRINSFKEQNREILNLSDKLTRLVNSETRNDSKVRKEIEQCLIDITNLAEIREPRGGAIPPYDFRSNKT